MHMHCLTMQRNQEQVSRIEACAWNFFIIDPAFLCQACVECIENNALNFSFRSNAALF